MIELDGNHIEGGGQIVRTALALSTITGKPFKIHSIRKGRTASGLKNQHLYCIKALEKLCNAKTDGAVLGSENLTFIPGKFEAQKIEIDVETAGSITLLLQSLLLPSMFGSSKTTLTITGGTDVQWSQPFDYFAEILVPQMRKYADIDVKLLKRGYYPKGQGKVEISITPKYMLKDFKGVSEFLSYLKEQGNKIVLLEQRHLMQVKGVSHASSDLQAAKVAERQALAAESLVKRLGCPVSIRNEYSNTTSTGSGITLWAIFSKNKDDIDAHNPIRIGADALGEKGKKAEDVGKEAAERLLDEVGYKAPVDKYLCDNLLPFIALFGGSIKAAKISEHALTNMYVIEKFLDVKFEVDKEKGAIAV